MSTISVSLTDFVDFLIRSGTTKATKVKEIKYRTGYTPATDYWRTLREGLKEFHRLSKPIEFLDVIPKRVRNNDSKRAAYIQVLESYKKVIRNKSIEWFDPPSHKWVSGDLSVHINPELGLVINGHPHLVKIYFKENSERLDTKLETNTLPLIHHLLTECADECPPKTSMSVFNARKGQLKIQKKLTPEAENVVHAEAASFITLWNRL